MDYDKTTIASTYDAARSYPAHVLVKWLDLVAAHAPTGTQVILDIGCGTGRFTYPLAERFQAHVIGVDPSEKMLRAAEGKASSGRVELRRAAAEELPLDDGSADLVFMSMMLHHLADRARAARECRRVLRTGGARDCAQRHARLPLSPGAVLSWVRCDRGDRIAIPQ
jgi:ubiquinone/menaquinone biosynthesis C-methylase UbiE